MLLFAITTAMCTNFFEICIDIFHFQNQVIGIVVKKCIASVYIENEQSKKKTAVVFTRCNNTNFPNPRRCPLHGRQTISMILISDMSKHF